MSIRISQFSLTIILQTDPLQLLLMSPHHVYLVLIIHQFVPQILPFVLVLPDAHCITLQIKYIYIIKETIWMSSSQQHYLMSLWVINSSWIAQWNLQLQSIHWPSIIIYTIHFYFSYPLTTCIPSKHINTSLGLHQTSTKCTLLLAHRRNRWPTVIHQRIPFTLI
jgi:hypothetical protein